LLPCADTIHVLSQFVKVGNQGRCAQEDKMTNLVFVTITYYPLMPILCRNVKDRAGCGEGGKVRYRTVFPSKKVCRVSRQCFNVGR
jgi:hypothetical protein